MKMLFYTHTCYLSLGMKYVFQGVRSFKQPLMQYSYHEFGILEFSAAGTVLPAPSPSWEVEVWWVEGRKKERGWGGERRVGVGGGPVLKNTLPALAVYISLARLWLFPWRRE